MSEDLLTKKLGTKEAARHNFEFLFGGNWKAIVKNIKLIKIVL